ncbi:hypothetical protein EGM51_09435 [Verrucomicrobia bacterium S94]|nr:hypothetical protein EGM51_09435 [Verrucomicrobia bacterium S94]
MHKLFPLITQRTFKNWRKKPPRFIPSTRAKMAESVDRLAPGGGAKFEQFLSSVFNLDIPDEAMEYPWAFNLRVFQDGILRGRFGAEIPPDARLFSETSLLEMESLERACFRLNALLHAADFEGHCQ